MNERKGAKRQRRKGDALTCSRYLAYGDHYRFRVLETSRLCVNSARDHVESA